MNITQVIQDDFDALYKFWQNAGLSVYPYGVEKTKFERMWSLNPDLCLKLVDENNELRGTVCGSYDGRDVSVNRLAVHPEARKKGYGKKLLEELENRVKQKGVNRISLKVNKKNTEVIGFYNKMGYVHENVITLKKKLNTP